jgi:hypothetical protein
MFVGVVRLGLVVSRIVMVCTQNALLPHWSVAVQVRAMTLLPPHVLLTTSLKTTLTEPQPSCALATPVILVVGRAGHSSTILLGQVIVGGVVSRMVIVWVQFVLFPQASAATHVRAMTFAPPQVLLTLSL